MGIQELLQNHRDQIRSIASKYGVSNIRVFGSVAHGEAQDESDIDFLVDLEEGRSYLDLGGLLMDLQALLRRRVDITTENALHWYIKDKILKEARPL